MFVFPRASVSEPLHHHFHQPSQWAEAGGVCLCVDEEGTWGNGGGAVGCAGVSEGARGGPSWCGCAVEAVAVRVCVRMHLYTYFCVS